MRKERKEKKREEKKRNEKKRKTLQLIFRAFKIRRWSYSESVNDQCCGRD